MKTINLFAASAMLLAAVACSSNKPAGNGAGADSTAVAPVVENVVSAKGLLPSKSEIDTVSYLVGINFGSFIKGYNLGDLNYNEIKKGINDFINAKGNQTSPDFVKQFKVNPEEMNNILQAFIEKRNAYTAAVNKEAQAKFFDEVKKKAGVQSSFVHYKLSLKDGSVIEEVTEDQPSVKLTLDRVIPGWTEGLQLIGKGGKATLYVPAELGYGERGSNAIEPNTPLVFDIQLDSIKRFVPVE